MVVVIVVQVGYDLLIFSCLCLLYFFNVAQKELIDASNATTKINIVAVIEIPVFSDLLIAKATPKHIIKVQTNMSKAPTMAVTYFMIFALLCFLVFYKYMVA